MATSTAPSTLDAIAGAARVLNRDGVAGLAEALALAGDALGSAGLWVRTVDATGRPDRVIASAPAGAGDAQGARGVDVPLRSGDRVIGLLSVAGVQRWPADKSLLLTALADLVALALAGSHPGPDPLADAVVLAGEDDAAELAAHLHDGPVQSLVAARYLVDLAAQRAATPAGAGADAGADGTMLPVREAVQAALVDVRRTLSRLSPRCGDAGLAGGLEVLARQAREWRGVPVDVAGAVPEGLPRVTVLSGYRLVQIALDDAADRGAHSAAVRVERDGGRLRLEIVDDGSGRAGLRPSLRRWDARLRLVGGSLRADTAGRIVPGPTPPEADTDPGPSGPARSDPGGADRHSPDPGRPDPGRPDPGSSGRGGSERSSERTPTDRTELARLTVWLPLDEESPA